jgi:hypothetical protein
MKNTEAQKERKRNKDYKKNEIVTIHKGNELKHYLETEITPDTKYYGHGITEFYI